MNKFGKLYLVATPIGNLEDLTLRASRILSEVNYVACEDTRKTRIILDQLNSKATTISFHAHSSESSLVKILELLLIGNDVCYVTDAGTPGISDPGNELVSFIRTESPQIEIIPIPGASALTAIASVSGFDLRKLLFVGFLPKKKSDKFLKDLISFDVPFVYYDSPHRLLKNLDKFISLGYGNLDCVVGRELTKKFETLYFGNINQVFMSLSALGKVKGEIVVIVNSSKSSSSLLQ